MPGFDESYERPAIEDIELGYRLRMAGRKVLLDKGLQVKHLKRWTFWGLVKTDVLDRGIPWTELILRDRCMPNDLNLELSQRVSVALAFLLLGICVAASIYWRGYFLTPLLALLIFLLSQYWLESASGPRSKLVLITRGAVCRGNRLAGARAPYELASRRRCCWAAFYFSCVTATAMSLSEGERSRGLFSPPIFC